MIHKNKIRQSTPTQSGVYFLFDKNKKLVYIGSSLNLLQRLTKRQKHEQHFKYVHFSLINETLINLRLIEKILIQKLRPIQNSMYVPNNNPIYNPPLKIYSLKELQETVDSVFR